MMKCRGMGKVRKIKAMSKGGSTKDACYYKVKSQYKVFLVPMLQVPLLNAGRKKAEVSSGN